MYSLLKFGPSSSPTPELSNGAKKLVGEFTRVKADMFRAERHDAAPKLEKESLDARQQANDKEQKRLVKEVIAIKNKLGLLHKYLSMEERTDLAMARGTCDQWGRADEDNLVFPVGKR